MSENVTQTKKTAEEKLYSDEKLDTSIYKCPNCGGDVVIKRGRFGEFKACSNYPKCKTIIK